MMLIVVAIKDTALDAFMRPFYVPRAGMAVRSFSDEVNRKDSEMNKHPTDYVLYELGTFDEDTGKFVNLDVPKILARGADHVS